MRYWVLSRELNLVRNIIHYKLGIFFKLFSDILYYTIYLLLSDRKLLNSRVTVEGLSIMHFENMTFYFVYIVLLQTLIYTFNYHDPGFDTFIY